MIIKLIIEGLLLGALLIAMCAFGIRHGPVNMVYLYDKEVQDRCVEKQLITQSEINKNSMRMTSVTVSLYLIALYVFVYVINKARGFMMPCIQMFVILSIVNLVDRFIIDEYWVNHTNAWIIPGTEDLMPYIDKKDKTVKWLTGTVGFAICSVLLAAIGLLIQ